MSDGLDRRWPAALLAVVCAPLAALAQDGQRNQPEGAAALELIREGYSKYFELKQLISKEQADWELEREILADRIDMVLDQIKELEEKTAEEEAKITEADREREELRRQLDDLVAIGETQLAEVQRAERTLGRMLPYLPEPLRNKVGPLAARLPEPGTAEEDIKLSISQRFGNVLGILNEVNKFHADIALVNERREVGGGRQAEVETMYLGVSKGFYAGSGETAEVAGRGNPGRDGFQWEQLPRMAADIARAIAIYENEEVAQFVPLEVAVRRIEADDTTTESAQ